jgi:hypothetical protein
MLKSRFLFEFVLAGITSAAFGGLVAST